VPRWSKAFQKHEQPEYLLMMVYKSRAKMISPITGRSKVKPLLLVFPFGLLSHYLRCLVLCRHLNQYFEIRFLFNATFSRFIEQEGFGTFRCSSLDPVKAIEGVKNFDFSWLEEREMERLLNDQVQVIQNLKPIAVLGDYAPTLRMASETTDTCYFSLMNAYMSKYFAAGRQISKNHPAYKLINHLPPKLAASLTRFGEGRAFAQLHIPFRDLRRKQGLAAYNSYLDELEGDINLVCDLPEIFSQKVLPGNYYNIGPLYYDRAPDTDLHQQTSDMRSKIDPNKTTILVSMGSSGNWNSVAFLNSRDFAQYNVVVVGHHEDKLRGDHIISAPFIGMHQVFPIADLVICHGGNGTLYQALYYGLPSLVSTNHCEQEWNLDAFKTCNAAEALPEGLTNNEVKALIESLVSRKQDRRLAKLSGLVRDWQRKLPGVLHDMLSPTKTFKQIEVEPPAPAARIA
jgi:UDP:flavonoid glycosyltransferase YjiC (YdhE family)